MCKEDVRIKRKTATRTKATTISTADNVTVFPPNPSRVSLIVSVLDYGLFDGIGTISVQSGPAGDPGPLYVVNITQPSVVMPIETYGTAITDEIRLVGLAAVNTIVGVTEVFFNEALADL